ncbi:MAG TPA: hypothetical protein VLV89_12165 [Candidatus Acidoferrum sp.]|nr:hypothetical protein [Candidatus Acidoferrum sp.]
MKTILALLSVVALGIAFAPTVSRAQLPPEWNDPLVDHFSGTWKMEGKIGSQDAHHEAQAEWVLRHQFLRIIEKTAADAPASERKYEATWYLGYDSTSDRYVMHLMDYFGGRFSETLGYGVREGNAIKFIFEYPDGPFHTTLRWFPEKNSWDWLMEQKDKDGKWTKFGDLTLARMQR